MESAVRNVGELISTWLREAGWTKTVLGDRIDRTPGHISHICSGRTNLNPDDAERIANAFGLNAEERLLLFRSAAATYVPAGFRRYVL